VTMNWFAEDKDGNELPTTYQWVRGSTDISGAIKEDYPLTSEDAGNTLAVVVSYDGISATSAGIKIPTTSTSTKTLEVTILGTPQVGNTLTADVINNFSGEIAYQWKRNGQDIPYWGNYIRYNVQPEDSGKTITVKVTSGGETKTSPPVTIQPITYTVTIYPDEDYLFAEVWIGADSYWPDVGGFSIQWLSDNANIPGATGYRYEPNAADAGKKIKAKVSGNGQQNVYSEEIQISAILRTTWKTEEEYKGILPEEFVDDDGNVWPAGEHYTFTCTLDFITIFTWGMESKKVMTGTGLEYNEDMFLNYRVSGNKVFLFENKYLSGRYVEYPVFSVEGGVIKDNKIVFSKAFQGEGGPEDLVFTKQQ
jgi:hypothetical protein